MKIKSINYIIFVVFTSTAITSCQSPDPISYNEKLINYCTELDNQVAKFNKNVSKKEYSFEDIQAEYNYTIRIYEENYKLLKKIKPMKKDPGLHKSIVDFYDGIKKIFNNEYKKILKLYKKNKNNKNIDEINNQARSKIIDLENNVTKFQKKFAEIYEIELSK